LAVTANNVSKVYGQANPSFSATYSGFVLGQSPSVLGGTLAFNTPSTTSSGVGSYPIAPSGLTSSNYAITFASGTLAVAPAPLIVIAANASRIYGAANPALTGAIAGVQNGDAITAGYATSATPASSLGNYAIIASLSDPTQRLSNYTVIVDDGTLTVTPAPLVVTPVDVSREFGAPNPAFVGAISGIQNGDDITASYSTTATVTSSLGTYPITATLNDPSDKLSTTVRR
jgi:hypothetical protein